MERFLDALPHIFDGDAATVGSKQRCGDATCGICKSDARVGGVSGGARGPEHKQNEAAVLPAQKLTVPSFKRRVDLVSPSKES